MIAITRDISPGLVRCELTHLARTPIDVDRARRQHDAYERCLEAAGCTVQRLRADDTMPDSVFVEDIAVVFDELALVTRPGAVSRRVETPAIAEALQRHRALRCVEAPATIDGGDVLVCGRHVYIGRTSRTNDEGIDQARRILEPFGYSVAGVDVRGCLHLKSAATMVDEERLLVNPEWVDVDDLATFELITIDPAEPFGANVLRIGDAIIASDAHPLTRRRLERHGFAVSTVDMSETAKAEGGVTCCSLLLRDLA